MLIHELRCQECEAGDMWGGGPGVNKENTMETFHLPAETIFHGFIFLPNGAAVAVALLNAR